MTAIEITVTPTHKYFMRKSKDDLVRWIELKKHGRQMLSFAEIDAQKRVYSKAQLANECMGIVRGLASRPVQTGETALPE